jgi:heptosyltransferase-3
MRKFPANKILLIATRQIGDVLLVTPLLRSLRHAYRDAVIDVLVYDNKGGMLESSLMTARLFRWLNIQTLVNRKYF